VQKRIAGADAGGREATVEIVDGRKAKSRSRPRSPRRRAGGVVRLMAAAGGVAAGASARAGKVQLFRHREDLPGDTKIGRSLASAAADDSAR
jgi:hypothetical protein